MFAGMETLLEALARLGRRGYTARVEVVPGGLRFRPSSAPATGLRRPEETCVDEVVRFEGQSDPADEIIVFALRDPTTGARGTWVAAFGPCASSVEGDLTRRLPTTVSP